MKYLKSRVFGTGVSSSDVVHRSFRILLLAVNYQESSCFLQKDTDKTLVEGNLRAVSLISPNDLL